jgi:hypothetical protein
MLDFVFVILGLLLLVPLLSTAKAQRKKILAGALPRAVEIATFHGWVSPGRLMTQENMTERDAKAALVEACRQGLLFQAEDGRFYLKQASLNSEVSNQQDWCEDRFIKKDRSGAQTIQSRLRQQVGRSETRNWRQKNEWEKDKPYRDSAVTPNHRFVSSPAHQKLLALSNFWPPFLKACAGIVRKAWHAHNASKDAPKEGGYRLTLGFEQPTMPMDPRPALSRFDDGLKTYGRPGREGILLQAKLKARLNVL